MQFRTHETVKIKTGDALLTGELMIPQEAKAMVIFSHGSGSSRLSPRNRKVAGYLHRHSIGTLLFDLLTPEEDAFYENRFNIDLLTQRLISVTRWLERRADAHGLPVGFFGASTGAASALRAASQLPEVQSVVSRGGRPDLAMDGLPAVKAAVLLIVGSLDQHVLRLNQKALQRLPGEKQLLVIEGATHLFEEPGKMEEVAMAAADWFEHHLAATSEMSMQ